MYVRPIKLRVFAKLELLLWVLLDILRDGGISTRPPKQEHRQRRQYLREFLNYHLLSVLPS
jgi:hypothetical protein